jgi:DNA-binding XRE family transcriptional regulator
MLGGTGIEFVVTADPAAKAAAEELIATAGIELPVVSTNDRLPRLKRRPDFLLYLRGSEPIESVRVSLERIAGAARNVAVVVESEPDLQKTFELGAMCQAILPGRSRGIYLRRQLQTLLAEATEETATESGQERLTVERLRNSLGLTQMQLAKIADVSARTVQNWEAQDKPVSESRPLSDLAELREILVDHVAESDIPEWLNSPNEKLNHKPVDLLLQGRTRDVLWQLRSVASGEPV